MEPTATWDAASVRSVPGAPRAYLTGLDGEPAAPIELPIGLAVTLGRDLDCGVRLAHKSVSRRHASVRFDGACIELVDHESRNGTFIDEHRLEGRTVLDAGAELRIGDRRLLVVLRPGRRPGGPAGRPVAADPTMLEVIARCERVAASSSSVLLAGETGAGKEILARWIHETSPRRQGPFVAVNCGAIPDAIASAELFGHEKGAFTGAIEARAGHFEAASGGTLLLDEIGDLAPLTQTKLLRALQERQIVRVGSTRTIDVDVRVIAATHRPLDALVREGRFREDLFYRLDVVRIEIPPLRERPLDVEPLARAFLEELAPGRAVRLDEKALAVLRAHPWPGNARQLRNVLERALALCANDVIDAAALGDLGASEVPEHATLGGRVADVERRALLEALELCAGNQSAAARRLGITRRALIYRMAKHGLRSGE